MLLQAQISGWLIVIGTASLVIILIFFFLLFLQYNRRQVQHVKQVHDLKSTFEHTLLQSQLEIQEQVFTHISQEVHDNIGQVLSLVRLNLKTLGERPVPAKIDYTDELLGKAINDLRSLTQKLNTNFIKDVGLVEAIRQLMTSIQRSGQFNTFLEIEDPYLQLEDSKSIILFRIVQEAINNIIKHSEATQISIVIRGSELLQSITIADNGKGFDTAANNQHRAGIGISNMIARSEIINVEINIKSSYGAGTTISIYNKT